MKLTSALAGALVVALGSTGHAAGQSVLFVGNSFTFGSGSAVRFYRSDTVADLNNEGIGGVPALFKSFTQQAGLDYDVALETRGGVGIDFHLENKLGVIGRRGWDKVVAHGYSTLDQEKPRDPAKLIATSKQLADFLKDQPPLLFDWLFEHTLFCAIDPSERDAYVQAVLRWLKPQGQYLAVNYLIPDTEGPPFGTTRDELWRRFSPHFDLLKEWVPRSYPNRTGLELMMWWNRKKL